MPKAKNKIDEMKDKEETKEILLDDEDKVIDAELVPGDIMSGDEDEDSEDADSEELDPFKDRWEE